MNAAVVSDESDLCPAITRDFIKIIDHSVAKQLEVAVFNSRSAYVQ